MCETRPDPCRDKISQSRRQSQVHVVTRSHTDRAVGDTVGDRVGDKVEDKVGDKVGNDVEDKARSMS